MRTVLIKSAGKVGLAQDYGDSTGNVGVVCGADIYQVSPEDSILPIHQTPSGSITCAYLLDSSTWCYADDSGNIFQFDAVSQRSKAVFSLQKPVLDLHAFGGVIAIATTDPQPLVVAHGEMMELTGNLKGTGNQVCFSSSGTHLCALDSDGNAAVYRFGDWKLIYEYTVPRKDTGKGKFRGGWNRSGEIFALPGDFRLVFLSVKTLEIAMLEEFRASEPISILQWTKVDSVIAILTSGAVLHLWDTSQNVILGSFTLATFPDSFLVKEDCFYYSQSPGILTVLTMAEMTKTEVKSISKTVQISNPFKVVIGAVPQESLNTMDSDIAETVLFRSLLGTVTRSRRKALIGADQVLFYAIDIVFFNSSFMHDLHFPDTNDLYMAYMSESGVVFASKSVGELGDDDFVAEDKDNRRALVLFKGFKALGDWSVKLPGTEDAEAVACGLCWCCVLTSFMFIRVFSVKAGVQLCAVSFSAPVLQFATYRDTLAILYHASVPISGAQSLATDTYEIAPSGITKKLRSVKLSIPTGSKVTWFGYSTAGVLSYRDSEGILRLFSSIFRTWEPVLKCTDLDFVGVGELEAFGYEEKKLYLSLRKFRIEECGPVSDEENKSVFNFPEKQKNAWSDMLPDIKEAAAADDIEEVIRLSAALSLTDKKKLVKILMESHLEIALALWTHVKSTIPVSKRPSEPVEPPEKKLKPS